MRDGYIEEESADHTREMPSLAKTKQGDVKEDTRQKGTCVR